MKKIVQIYDLVEEKYLVFQLGISVLVIFFQVVMRSVFNSSLSWSEELARYLYIWQGWLGISLIERRRKHISIDILKNKFHGAPRKILDTIVQLVCIATSGFMASFGFKMVAFTMASGTASTAMRIPLFIIYAAMPVGCSLYCLRVLFHMLEDLGILKTGNAEVAE